MADTRDARQLLDHPTSHVNIPERSGMQSSTVSAPIRRRQMTKSHIAKKHDVDTHVGKRIRYRRLVNGTTQQQLADVVGIRFQQIQKYETGMNRVSASRLWDIANSLSVPVSFFFEGLETDAHVDKNTVDLPGDTSTNKETLDLLRFCYALPESQRRRFFDLVRVLSKVA